jgi:hypothetical protein
MIGGDLESTRAQIFEPGTGFGLIAGTVSESEMPFAIFIPRVRVQEGVFVVGARIYVGAEGVEPSCP